MSLWTYRSRDAALTCLPSVLILVRECEDCACWSRWGISATTLRRRHYSRLLDDQVCSSWLVVGFQNSSAARIEVYRKGRPISYKCQTRDRNQVGSCHGEWRTRRRSRH